MDGVCRTFARSITSAFGLLQSTTSVIALPLALKYRMIFSAFVPDPDAKIAMRFIFKVTK